MRHRNQYRPLRHSVAATGRYRQRANSSLLHHPRGSNELGVLQRFVRRMNSRQTRPLCIRRTIVGPPGCSTVRRNVQGDARLQLKVHHQPVRLEAAVLTTDFPTSGGQCCRPVHADDTVPDYPRFAAGRARSVRSCLIDIDRLPAETQLDRFLAAGRELQRLVNEVDPRCRRRSDFAVQSM